MVSQLILNLLKSTFNLTLKLSWCTHCKLFWVRMSAQHLQYKCYKFPRPRCSLGDESVGSRVWSWDEPGAECQSEVEGSSSSRRRDNHPPIHPLFDRALELWDLDPPLKHSLKPQHRVQTGHGTSCPSETWATVQQSQPTVGNYSRD